MMNILRTKNIWLPITLTIGIFTVVAAAAQTRVYSGYGYIVDCRVAAPENLAVETSTDGKNITLSWDAVEFTDCDATAADHYRVQVRYNDATLISDFTSVTGTEKTIALRTLQRNRSYKFHVRAIASDDTQTDWSDYKLFRTTPKRPSDLSIHALTSRSVRATWGNVARSQNLRYYQVIVSRGNHVVYRKNVRIGLRRASTGLIIRRLRPDTRYALKVRAVATTTVAGEFKSVRFTTPTE